MTMRLITDADRVPGMMKNVVGATLAGKPKGEMRFWWPLGGGHGMWAAPNTAGITMPLRVTHIHEPDA